MRHLRAIWAFLAAAVDGWIADRAPSMGAAISYYTLFSLAPILILVIAIAGLAFGQDAAEGAIEAQLHDLVGETAARAVQGMIASAADTGAGIVATLIGLATLLIGATTVFGELQASLNVIWKARPDVRRTGLWNLVRQRLLSLSMVLGIGFILMVSLVVNALIAALADYLAGLLPGLDVVVQALNFALSFGAFAVLFAMIYKVLPDTTVAWRDVWVGAAMTALLFTVGRFAISLYIGSSRVATSYGAAGAVVILLVWVYYSAQIFLFGAELTKAFAEHFGSRSRPPPAPPPPV